MSEINEDNLRTFIPTDEEVDALTSAINRKLNNGEDDPAKIQKYYFIESITEFYWDDEVKWFIFARLDDGSNKYIEFVYKYPSFGGCGYPQCTDTNLDLATHGYPAHSQTVWEDEEALDYQKGLRRNKNKKTHRKRSK